ncbi:MULTISPECIES: DUF3090 domain-containing protein [unclassified Luteococcus]|uniref:DUF3090 domain-containing protein n=1 Tax=unclassified Luteococcus TaxID=2639923 RepID=UPI00313C174F
MPRITHRFEFPDRFVAGTVGQPGQRTFFVQARERNRLVSVVCEKQQVEVLADHLERILDELAKLTDGTAQIPPQRVAARDLDPLDAPLEEDFRAGTMTIAWDGKLEAVQVELFSVADDEDLDIPEEAGQYFDELAQVANAAECLSVTLSADQARDFTARARALVHAGRPACPFCSQPINPTGHICPRANGYRRPLFL